MASIVFDKVSKSFDGTRVIEALDLEAQDGELLVLVGPSGCGKSTLLCMLAGLEEISIDGKRVNELPPQQRKLAMVFQNYALYPHMTVQRNLAFPLHMQRLSGGQRQRVAMGRAIVRDADVFLMDKPLSNLDAKLRVQIRSDIAALQARLGTTTLYVTHD
jgi:ABC-type sugar transport system ATPase subunit